MAGSNPGHFFELLVRCREAKRRHPGEALTTTALTTTALAKTGRRDDG
jgi:hypothetical protein